MALSDAIEKLGRAIFEAPFGGSRLTPDSPELAEIRLAVLDAVKNKTHHAGPQRVFAWDIVRIHLRGVPVDQAGAFQGAVLAEYLAQEVRAALVRSACRFPEELRVDVETTPQLPGPGEEWIWLEFESTPSPAPKAGPDRLTAAARLVVTHGRAAEAELTLTKARTNIGRSCDVFRAEGPSRRNDLAFSEDDEINRTVSREHAHIRFDKKTGEYRLYNDRWYKAGAHPDAGCGLWILRDGLSQPVHRNERGVLLNDGDEIHLGRAIVRFVRG